jgi:hypothetical protein
MCFLLLEEFGSTAGASVVMLSAMTSAVAAAYLRIGITSLMGVREDAAKNGRRVRGAKRGCGKCEVI